MAEISNKTLALLLVVAIVISLAGTFVALNRLSQFHLPRVTGLATSSGTLSIEVAESVSINFSSATMDFGAGAVDSGKEGCLVQNNYTNGSALTITGDAIDNNCTADPFTGNASNFVVENIGNRNVTLNITGKDARTLFGVSGGNYSFNITQKPGEIACMNASGESVWDGGGVNNTQIPWTVFTGTGAANEIELCNATDYGMPFETANNEFYINIRMNIPYLAYGALVDTITVEATSHTK